MTNSFTSIYILKLQDNKFYVGKSNDAKKRIHRHFNGEGSIWTKKYPPIKVVEVIDYCDNFDEDKYTLMYMSIYGMENVRGGAFCSIELGGADKYILTRMICGSTNKCVKCKKFGHYFTNCPLNTNKRRIISISTETEEETEEESEEETEEESEEETEEESEEETEEESRKNVPLTRSNKRKLEETQKKNKKQKK